MKIALVSPYDFAYPGGVVNHISALEQYFTKMGHEVKIIAPASKAVSNLGDRLIPIGKPRPIPVSGSIARITISLRLASRIKEVLAKEKFDIERRPAITHARWIQRPRSESIGNAIGVGRLR